MTDSQSGVQTTDAQVNSQKLTNTKDIIAYLAEKFPLCFILEGEAKPLKIGLFQDLAEALQAKLSCVRLFVNTHQIGVIYMVVAKAQCA